MSSVDVDTTTIFFVEYVLRCECDPDLPVLETFSDHHGAEPILLQIEGWAQGDTNVDIDVTEATGTYALLKLEEDDAEVYAPVCMAMLHASTELQPVVALSDRYLLYLETREYMKYAPRH